MFNDVAKIAARIWRWLLPQRGKPKGIRWSQQYLAWQGPFGKPAPNAPRDIIHFGRSQMGMFEIYESEAGYLLSYPRRSKIPASMHQSLAQAKKRAALVLTNHLKETPHD